LNLLSIQWTPYDPAHFQRFEVDFDNAITHVRVVTQCAAQTTDTGQPPMPSGGCELALDPAVWSTIANQNRDGDGVAVTVRGTTDGSCATSSGKTTISFAGEDLLGTLYYWKSTVSTAGVGGEIWVKDFGDTAPEQVVMIPASQGGCSGCHALSRDGVRMVINSDDDDSDDEYSDMGTILVDRATGNRISFMPPGNPLYNSWGAPPGFATFNPDHTLFLLSNGKMAQSTNGVFEADTNVLFLTDGVNGGLEQAVQVGPTPMIVTMPDWSPDGRSVVLVVPQETHGPFFNDDSHLFGGSLYTLPYAGNMAFGAPSPLLMSAGENNYYPSYSPDGKLVVFDRAPRSPAVALIDGCIGTAPQRSCPNDSYSNPNARLMVMKPTPGAQPVDLENANGSPATSPVALSNSWPKWSPFLQLPGRHAALAHLFLHPRLRPARAQPLAGHVPVLSARKLRGSRLDAQPRVLAAVPAAPNLDGRHRHHRCHRQCRRPRSFQARVLAALPGHDDAQSHSAVDAAPRAAARRRRALRRPRRELPARRHVLRAVSVPGQRHLRPGRPPVEPG
jgi:hypothetical protein